MEDVGQAIIMGALAGKLRATAREDGIDGDLRGLEKLADAYSERVKALLEQTEGPPQMSSSGPPREHQPWRGRRCA